MTVEGGADYYVSVEEFWSDKHLGLLLYKMDGS